jgi:hypothetical protein
MAETVDGHLAKNSRNDSALTSPLRRYQGGTGSHWCVVALPCSCHGHQHTDPHQVVHGRGKGVNIQPTCDTPRYRVLRNGSTVLSQLKVASPCFRPR